LHPNPVHNVAKHFRQGIEGDHFPVRKNMPKFGGSQSFKTARRTIAGFDAMPWLRKGFGFSGDWTVSDQNDLLACILGPQKVNKAGKHRRSRASFDDLKGLRRAQRSAGWLPESFLATSLCDGAGRYSPLMGFQHRYRNRAACDFRGPILEGPIAVDDIKLSQDCRGTVIQPL
jgi:hypothetical protein